MLRSELEAEIARVVLASSHFEVLGLQPAARCDPASVNKAFKRMARSIHPDKVMQRRKAKEASSAAEGDVRGYHGATGPAEVERRQSQEEDAASPVRALATPSQPVEAPQAPSPQPDRSDLLRRAEREAAEAERDAAEAARRLEEAINEAPADGLEPGSKAAMQRLNEAKAALLESDRCAAHYEQLRAGSVGSTAWARDVLEELRFRRLRQRAEADLQERQQHAAVAERQRAAVSSEAVAEEIAALCSRGGGGVVEAVRAVLEGRSKELNLVVEGLASLPESFGQLGALTTLGLTNNQLASLP